MTHSMNNPFTEFIQRTKDYPNEYSKSIHQLVSIQEDMLKKFDFEEERGAKAVRWIETFCILTEGEHAGERVKLLLWQKWFIYSIFCFYGEFDEEDFDEKGNVIGVVKRRSRVVKDVMLLIASGNAKTTLFAFINTYILFQKEFNSPNIFIGSNSHQQSRLCFDATMKCIRANKVLMNYSRVVDSRSMIEVPKNNSKLVAMSSDGGNQEGIVPAVIVIDETHIMKDSSYADNLRKSTKRSDLLILEGSTHGTVRGGYLDQRIELARKILSRDVAEMDYRKLFVLFEQDSEDEVFSAYKNEDFNVFKKSNPSLSYAVSLTMLKDKVKEMLNDPRSRTVNLTKNFNIPQNPQSSFYTKAECKTNTFNEDCLYGAPVFVGLDMAWTRTPNSDLTALRFMMVNPFTDDRYCKDVVFLPKYYDHGDGSPKEDMIALKSKEDSNILFNKKQNKYGYQLYANRGDVVIVDEDLVNKLVDIYGEGARIDCTGITEDFIIYYIAYLERKYQFRICKFGLDPNKASRIESYFNRVLQPLDDKDICVKFQMEKTQISNPIVERTKDLRHQGLVYCNNKLTELHFAEVQVKETSNGFKLVNSIAKRKDLVISECACESAYNVFTTNRFSGAQNLEMLKGWWSENAERLKTFGI